MLEVILMRTTMAGMVIGMATTTTAAITDTTIAAAMKVASIGMAVMAATTAEDTTNI